MVSFGNECKTYKQISFPQYSYIQKRENVMNAEVFTDAYKQLEEMVNEEEGEPEDAPNHNEFRSPERSG